MSTEKRLRITLTNRSPVLILGSEWPVVARAEGDDYTGSDYARRQQAIGQGECQRWTLTARQHADGRSLVYARTMSDWHGAACGEDGGKLLDPGSDLAMALRSVGERAGIPEETIADAIASLPAEEI